MLKMWTEKVKVKCDRQTDRQRQNEKKINPQTYTSTDNKGHHKARESIDFNNEQKHADHLNVTGVW